MHSFQTLLLLVLVACPRYHVGASLLRGLNEPDGSGVGDGVWHFDIEIEVPEEKKDVEDAYLDTETIKCIENTIADSLPVLALDYLHDVRELDLKNFSRVQKVKHTEEERPITLFEYNNGTRVFFEWKDGWTQSLAFGYGSSEQTTEETKSAGGEETSKPADGVETPKPSDGEEEATVTDAEERKETGVFSLATFGTTSSYSSFGYGGPSVGYGGNGRALQEMSNDQPGIDSVGRDLGTRRKRRRRWLTGLVTTTCTFCIDDDLDHGRRAKQVNWLDYIDEEFLAFMNDVLADVINEMCDIGEKLKETNFEYVG